MTFTRQMPLLLTNQVSHRSKQCINDCTSFTGENMSKVSQILRHAFLFATVIYKCQWVSNGNANNERSRNNCRTNKENSYRKSYQRLLACFRAGDKNSRLYH